MKILEAELENFGNFVDEKLTFHDGINVIWAKNGAGKSTIHEFILAMLYGLNGEEYGMPMRSNMTASIQENWMLLWNLKRSRGSSAAGSLTEVPDMKRRLPKGWWQVSMRL